MGLRLLLIVVVNVVNILDVVVDGVVAVVNFVVLALPYVADHNIFSCGQ